MNTRLDSAQPVPARLALYHRKWTAVIGIVFFLLLLPGSVLSAYVLASILGIDGNKIPVMITLFLFAVVLSMLIPTIKVVLEKGPALVIDAEGIMDYVHTKTLILWSDIESASINYGEKDSIVIRFKAGALLPKGQVVKHGLGRTLLRAFKGGDLAIPIVGLKYDPRLLSQILAAHVRRNN